MNKQTASPVVVWDLPVRVLHWLIVICVGVSWWSAEQRLMEVHRYSGYALLGCIVFRLYWGFAGSSTARFVEFARGPPTHAPAGHNPLGGWSVVALLALLLVQVTLGLFVTDIDGLESGPLSYLVSFETSRLLADAHEIVFNVLLGFVVLHIVAVFFYLLVRRTNLIGAMLTGRRPAASVGTHATLVSLWRIVPGLALAGLAVWYVARQ